VIRIRLGTAASSQSSTAWLGRRDVEAEKSRTVFGRTRRCGCCRDSTVRNPTARMLIFSRRGVSQVPSMYGVLHSQQNMATIGW